MASAVSEPSPPSADDFGERLLAAGADAGERDPEAQRWRADLAARMFGEPRRDVTIGRFTVLSRVGGGASGVVYAAHDPQLDRKVALKVLRADLGMPSHRAAQWLAREAKILARLSHPNVVPIYDVGEDDGRVFIALELVEGRSLRPWMEERHPWPEVVEVFAQAGRGLAAAHAAGLVHRDFKPENVLLGDDERVRVSDFGIARRLAPPAEEVVQTHESGADVPPPSASASLTSHRHAGTPGYMAPEQFLGDPVDARTDQFGFCVALHEALYGERPFAGTTRASLAANVIAGRRRTGPRGVAAPTWLDRVVARGLEVEPDRRYPSMDALLDDLERRRAGRKRWLVGGAFAVGLVAAAMLGREGGGEPDPCAGAEAKVAAVWSPARRAEVSDAFLATGLPYAEDSARRVGESLEAYGQAWSRAHGAACEGATEEAVMQRMYCLQSRLLELESLAELFAHADPRVVEHAVASTASLVSPQECMYVGEGQRRGDDEAGPVEAAELRMEIARAKALGDTGQPQQARSLARTAAQRARDLADRTLEAEALLVASHMERVLLGVIERSDAELTAYSAVLAAEAAHRPDLLARGLVEYLSVTVSLGRLQQAWKWERRAREAVSAIGAPPELMGRIEYTIALAESYSGRLEESEAAAARALARFAEGGPPTRRWVSTAENLVGELTFESGRYVEALPRYERSLDIAVEEMGPEHTWVASAHGNMAEVFYLSGRYDEAQRHFEEALRIREGCFGPTSVWVIHTQAHLGDVDLVRGRSEEALARYRQALEAREQLRRMAGDRPSTDDEMLSVFRDLQAWDQDQWLHYGIALALLQLGRVDEARAHVALVPEPQLPDDRHHPDLIGRLDVPGWVELADGALPAALGAFERALDRMEAELGPRHRMLVYPLLGLGQTHLRRGAPSDARPYLERALRIHEALPEVEPRVRGDLRLSLALSLRTHPDRLDEARSLMNQARSDYMGAPEGAADRVAEIDAWLVEHGSAPSAGRARGASGDPAGEGDGGGSRASE